MVADNFAAIRVIATLNQSQVRKKADAFSWPTNRIYKQSGECRSILSVVALKIYSLIHSLNKDLPSFYCLRGPVLTVENLKIKMKSTKVLPLSNLQPNTGEVRHTHNYNSVK